jgi:hypothetical protein
MGGFLSGFFVGAFIAIGTTIACFKWRPRIRCDSEGLWIDEALERAIEAADQSLQEV